MNARDLRGLVTVGGVLILLRMLMTKTVDAKAWGEGWHFPVPDLKMPDGRLYRAEVSQEFKPITHVGTDIMYHRHGSSDMQAEWPQGLLDAGGAKATSTYFAPIGTPILAARNARVWSVTKHATGWAVVLDHGKPWATRYFHLATVEVPLHTRGKRNDGGPATVVLAGEKIGTMGHNPNTDPAKGVVDHQLVRHLHFEALYKGGSNDDAVDPEPVMPMWGRSQWTP